ncbi:MAG: hypothetical protein PHQ59_02075 [Candidatus Daviesbacteria bacterium]|nr:hypothetical protein [Candidatus Daviesbacteria bacterium]
MSREFKTLPGGVMGYIASTDSVPSKIAFNCDQEAKSGKTDELSGLIAEAIATAAEGKGNPDAHARAVLRARWFGAE